MLHKIQQIILANPTKDLQGNNIDKIVDLGYNETEKQTRKE